MNKSLACTALLGLASALSLSLSLGCSSTPSDDGEIDSEYRKKPKANENWSSLTLQLPTGTCQPGGTCSRPLGATANIQLDGATVTLGAANRVKPGDHTVTVNGVGKTVTLAAGASKTMVLPIAHRKCQAANLPNVANTDFGATISLSNASCPSTTSLVANTNNTKPTITLYTYNWGCPAGNYVVGTLSSSTSSSSCAPLGSTRVYSVNINGTCVDLRQTRADGQYGINPTEACNSYVAGDTSWAAGPSNTAQFADYDLAFVPGDYTVAIGSGSGSTSKTFTLKEGDTAEIPVALPVIGSVPSTFNTTLKFADPRELPDAHAATITSSCSGDRTYTVPANTTATQSLKAFTASSCVYTLNAGGRTVTLNQSSSNSITLQRLDVDNVEVTRENGSTYTVAGTYELYFGGARVAGPYNTNTGIDVLPGTYELVTSFSTADGPQTQRETLNL
ncbi:MAG: hypothetical protein U0235_20110 [Polyangiaceae bacterium]